MAGLAQETEVTTRIVVHDHGKMRVAFLVFFDRFNHRNFAGECEIEDVAACARFQTHTIALPDLDAVNGHHVEQRFIFQ